jgi:phage I-like protein
VTAVAEAQGPAAVDSPTEAGERIVIESAALSGQAPPGRVLVAPWGEVKSVNGTFVVDEESARLVVEAYRAHGTDIPIDYEHQSLGGIYASPSGQAPAAGWIRGLRAVTPAEAGEGEAGLLAEVEWTPAAEQKLAGREYRYLSPVVLVRKSDRRVMALHSVALTNKPAIVGMRPIVNREPDLPADRAAQAPQPVRAEAGQSSTSEAEKVELLRHRLGLDAGCDFGTVLTAAEDRIASLAGQIAQREAQDKVDAAVRAGKLTMAQREWAMSLALKDGQAFDEWAASAPVLVMPGRTSPPSSAGQGEAAHKATVIASARRAFHGTPELVLLTSESAWISDSLREAGLDP